MKNDANYKGCVAIRKKQFIKTKRIKHLFFFHQNFFLLILYFLLSRKLKNTSINLVLFLFI